MSTFLMPSPRQYFRNNNSDPAAGCLLYTYAAGTTTPKDCFTDSAGLIPHTNPIVLDAKGEALIYFSGAYKIDLKTPAGVQITGYPVDDFIATDVAADVTAAVAALVGYTTASYPTFADALAATVGETLVVNSVINITADTLIPETTAVEVRKGGMFVISPAVELRISGPLDAGEYQIFSGAGTVVFTASSRSRDIEAWHGGGYTAIVSQGRTLLQNAIDPGGPVHAYEDNNVLDFTYPIAPNYNAYAAFDAKTNATGVGDYDHMVGFQARQTYSGSGSIWSRWDHFNSLPTHSGTGVVANLRHFRVQDPLGVGPITFQAAYYSEKLTRATENYGLFLKNPINVIRTAAGEDAILRLQGNGQVGAFGFSIASEASSAVSLNQAANQDISIWTNNTERMRIWNTGIIKIGSPALILTNAQQVEIQGAGGITLKATGGAGNACSLNWNNAIAGDNLFQMFYTETIPAACGSIDFNRAANVTRYNTASDGTLKNIIGDADLAASVALLDATRLREYSWKSDAENRPQMGVIAQELHATFPGAVSVGGEYEEDGETKYRPWQVDKTAFTFHLIAGYQHQQKLIAALEARLAALEAK